MSLGYKYSKSLNRDLLILTLTIYTAVIFPYYLFIGISPSSVGLSLIYLVDAIFLIEIVSRYNSTKTIYWKEVIFNLPYELPFLFLSNQIFFLELDLILLIRIIRLFRLIYLVRILKKWDKNSIIQSANLRLSKVLLWVSLSIHWLACIWYGLALINHYPIQSWVQNNGFLSLEKSDQYLRSLYWVVTTLTTVGYGDITPNLNYEIVFSILLMILGASLYAYIIGTVASIFSTSNMNKSFFRKQVHYSLQYLNQRKVDSNIIDKVEDYYNFIWEKNKGFSNDKSLDSLPKALKAEVMLSIVKDHLNKTSIFNYTEPALRNVLIDALEIQSYPPETKIIEEGTVGDSIYFVIEGVLSVLKNGSIIEVFKEGEYFGDLSLLLNEKTTADIVSTSFCELLVLNRQAYELISTNYPEFKNVLKKASKNKGNKMASLLARDIIL